MLNKLIQRLQQLPSFHTVLQQQYSHFEYTTKTLQLPLKLVNQSDPLFSVLNCSQVPATGSNTTTDGRYSMNKQKEVGQSATVSLHYSQKSTYVHLTGGKILCPKQTPPQIYIPNFWLWGDLQKNGKKLE